MHNKMPRFILWHLIILLNENNLIDMTSYLEKCVFECFPYCSSSITQQGKINVYHQISENLLPFADIEMIYAQ